MTTHGNYSAWLEKPGNKEARRRMNREHRRKNNARIREQERAWHASRPLYLAVKRARLTAARQNVPFDLDDRLIDRPERCPILGLVLAYGPGNNCVKPNSPSLDRIQSKLGYVLENVRVISHRANTIKSDATAEELAAVLEYVKGAK